MAKPLYTFVAFTFIALLVAGCAPLQPQRPSGSVITESSFEPGATLAPRSFASEEELRAFVSAYSAESNYYTVGGFARGALAMDSAAAPSSGLAKSESAVQRDFSTTNNQVEGVDEADIIKTDGEYIYTVTGQTLFIVKAYPGDEAEVVATVELPGMASGLFVEGDDLAVMGYFYDVDYFTEHDLRPHSGMTYLNTYSVANRAEPRLVEEYKFEGSYLQGRLQGGTMYVLVQSSPDIAYPMPIIMRGETRSSVAVRDIAFFPYPYDYPQFVTLHALPISGGALRSTTLTVEGGNTLYMSPDNIFIAYTKHVNEWKLRVEILMQELEPRLSSAERDRIERIRAVDDDVLSSSEKESKVTQVYYEHLNFLPEAQQRAINERVDARLKEKLDSYESLEYTIIHRIDTERLAVQATGQVPGRLNNQFSMDEYQGNLRVATTRSERWDSWRFEKPMPVDIGGGAAGSVDGSAPSQGASEQGIAVPDTPVSEPSARRIMPPMPSVQSSNDVYVLDSALNVIGRLEGLAPGEQIFSTRYVGERLYMVTFRQVDPFFVIDLSVPESPRELGQLKIPGFSRYLHPYDDNTIIGIGRDATELGRQQGLKISLFDVSDVSRPRELTQWVSAEEHAQSQAEWEHKAFLFDREKQLLVIPAYSYSWDSRGGQQQYNGALVFSVRRDEVTLRGVIDHSQGRQQYWGQLVERSLFIEELLYTKSPNLLRINSLEDLSAVKNVTLTETGAKSPYPVY
jgi:inhibitor of cysteine peptidase